ERDELTTVDPVVNLVTAQLAALAQRLGAVAEPVSLPIASRYCTLHQSRLRELQLRHRRIGGMACERSRYGAFSTPQQAAGRLDILGPARGIECSSTMLLDHRSISSLWQPSPSGRGGCPSHSGLSGGQSRRT